MEQIPIDTPFGAGTHPTFGTVHPTTLATIAKRPLGENMVDVDLYLAPTDLSKLTAASLDPFVRLLDGFENLSDAVR